MAVAVAALEITGGGGAFTVSVRPRLPVPVEFVAERVTVREPVVRVVPEIRPVEALTLRPEGRLLAP